MLKELLTNLKSWEAWDFSAFKIEKDDAEIIIPIIEKAMQKKPLIKGISEKTIIAKCPACGIGLVYIRKYNTNKTYCNCCGQLLDWEEPYRTLQNEEVKDE